MRVLLIGPYDVRGKQIQERIRRSLSDPEIQVATADSLTQDSPGITVAEMMSDAIESADLVIADVSQDNPDVLYELGLAHGLRKPTILLINSRVPAPRTVRDLRQMYYVYDPDDLSHLITDLRHNVMSYFEHRTKR